MWRHMKFKCQGPQIKLYENKAMFLLFHIFCGCFCATRWSQVTSTETVRPTNPERFTIRPVQKKRLLTPVLGEDPSLNRPPHPVCTFFPCSHCGGKAAGNFWFTPRGGGQRFIFYTTHSFTSKGCVMNWSKDSKESQLYFQVETEYLTLVSMIFYFILFVDYSLHSTPLCISFRGAAQRTDVPGGYAAFPPITPGPTRHLSHLSQIWLMLFITDTEVRGETLLNWNECRKNSHCNTIVSRWHCCKCVCYWKWGHAKSKACLRSPRQCVVFREHLAEPEFRKKPAHPL